MENYGKYMQVLNLIKLFHTQRGNGIQSIKQNRENCRCGCSRCILIINFSEGRSYFRSFVNYEYVKRNIKVNREIF